MSVEQHYEVGDLYENQDYLYYVCYAHKHYVSARLVGLQNHLVEDEYKDLWTSSDARRLSQYADRRLLSLLGCFRVFNTRANPLDLGTANFLHAVRWQGSIGEWCVARRAWRPNDAEIDTIDREIAGPFPSMITGPDKEILAEITTKPIGEWRRLFKERYPEPASSSTARDFWLHLYPRELL